MRRIVPAIALAALITAFLVLQRSSHDKTRSPFPTRGGDKAEQPGDSARPFALADRRDGKTAPDLSAASIEELAKRPLPRSLEGTEPDGALEADANGRLRLGPEIIDFFDYFLTTTGEEPLKVIRARIVAEIKNRLSPAAAQDAIELFERYLQYRDRARDLEPLGDQSATEQFQRIRNLRREVFGEQLAQALFGELEALERVAVAQYEIVRDSALPKEDKRRRIEELNQQLPEPVREAHEQAMKPARFFQEQKQLLASGGSPEEVRALREQYWGAEAADRLEDLDRQRAAWQSRVDEYRAARRVIEADSKLGSDAKRRAIEQLLETRFSERERLRVRALDRIDGITAE